MANHAQVTTKKKMTPEAVTALLERLNKDRFKSILKIEYSDCRNELQAWGSHVWMLTTPHHPDGGDYGSRVCWLNTSRRFEIRHGGGAEFIWWIDNAITNEVALVFDGYIVDDGTGPDYKEVGDPMRYLSFEDSFPCYNNSLREYSKQYLEDLQKFIPEPFRS